MLSIIRAERVLQCRVEEIDESVSQSSIGSGLRRLGRGVGKDGSSGAYPMNCFVL